MNVIEHWREAQRWLARAADEGDAGPRRFLYADIARTHFAAVSAGALMGQHYPAAYAEAVAAGIDPATVARMWIGSPHADPEPATSAVGASDPPPGSPPPPDPGTAVHGGARRAAGGIPGALPIERIDRP